jgi:hypothetical protein
MDSRNGNFSKTFIGNESILDSRWDSSWMAWWELRTLFNSSFKWFIWDSMWVTMRFSRSWLRVWAMMRGKYGKRWEIKVGEKGGWVNGKTRLRNDRYHCDQDKKRIPMEYVPIRGARKGVGTT